MVVYCIGASLLAIKFPNREQASSYMNFRTVGCRGVARLYDWQQFNHIILHVNYIFIINYIFFNK